MPPVLSNENEWEFGDGDVSEAASEASPSPKRAAATEPSPPPKRARASEPEPSLKRAAASEPSPPLKRARRGTEIQEADRGSKVVRDGPEAYQVARMRKPAPPQAARSSPGQAASNALARLPARPSSHAGGPRGQPSHSGGQLVVQTTLVRCEGVRCGICGRGPQEPHFR